MIVRLRFGIVVAAFSVAAAVGRAEDPTLPTFRSFAGAFLAAEDHNFFVESELRLPIYRQGPAALYFRHYEATPFLEVDGDGVQAELLHTREEGQLDWRLGEYVRLIGVGGYQAMQLQDRSGQRSAVAFGGGVGAPLRTDGERVFWYTLAGGYADRRRLDSDWWTDLYGSWRIVDFARDQYMGSQYRASVNLAGELQSSNRGGRFRGLYRVGPELQFLTANGNRANLALKWYHNDDHPFFGLEEQGLLVGLDVTSSRDDEYVFRARERRQPGWFPLVWGDYDAAFSGSRRVQRFTMNVEVVDFVIAERRLTGFIWYESHQERRIGDFDNISYSVTLGIQTPVGLESAFSQGDPLVLGVDFLHRSDHALNPDPERVAEVGEPSFIGKLIPNGSINILPRLRLQTLGWDLPYRDPAMYERKTEWLNQFDWRVTAGYVTESSRGRDRFAGQLGLNWDVATVDGYVVYVLGIGSVGEETPDWRVELGVRRPAVKVFARYEDYGISRNIARGELFVVGLGVHL